jgi:hypothetical protein
MNLPKQTMFAVRLCLAAGNAAAHCHSSFSDAPAKVNYTFRF